MLIGLTGQSGAGKSTVSKVFKENGYFVVDADKVSRKVSESESGKAALKAAFGEGVFESGNLNRKKLASIVFNDKKELQKLNTTLLPLICNEIDKIVKESGSSYILLDAPTLFESGINSRCDIILAVTAPFSALVSRIMARDFLTKEEAESRISSQHSDSFFKENADIVLENNGTLDGLKDKALSTAIKIKNLKTI